MSDPGLNGLACHALTKQGVAVVAVHACTVVSSLSALPCDVSYLPQVLASLSTGSVCPSTACHTECDSLEVFISLEVLIVPVVVLKINSVKLADVLKVNTFYILTVLYQ